MGGEDDDVILSTSLWTSFDNSHHTAAAQTQKAIQFQFPFSLSMHLFPFPLILVSEGNCCPHDLRG
jgi:hypothetical protein